MKFQKASRRAISVGSWALIGVLSSGVLSNGAMSVAVAKTESANRAPISVSLSAFKVVTDKNGQETFVAASKARPGDILEYRALTTNSSTRSVSRVQPTIPIPTGLVFVASSARPANAQASTDGRTFGALPLRRAVRDANGAQKIVLVPLSQYRAVRWTIGQLAAGQSVQVSARARLRASAEKEATP